MKKLLLLGAIALSINALGQANNYSLQFDGINDYVSVGNDNSLNPSTQLSLMCAFNVAQYPSEDVLYALIGRNTTTASDYGYSLGLRYNNGQVQLEFGIGKNISGANISVVYQEINYNFGEWAHVAGVFNQDTINLYYNGTLVHESVINGFGSLHSNNYETLIGKYRPSGGEPNWFYEGLMDNVHIWGKALSQEEVQNMYCHPPSGEEININGFWNFEEGTGVSTADNTPNTNNGTLTNGPIWSTNTPLSLVSSGTDVQVACDSYTWIDGNTYITNNNTATHILTNSAGCNSIVTLDLTISTNPCSFNYSQGDLNCDGQVTAADLTTFLSNFGLVIN